MLYFQIRKYPIGIKTKILMLQFDTETSGPVLQYQMLEVLPGRKKGLNGVVCRAIVFLFCTNTGSWRDILHLKLYRLQVLSPEKRNSNCVSYSHFFLQS